MSLFYVLTGSAACLFSIALIFVYLVRKQTQLQLISKAEVGGKNFYAVRLEGEDFLFLKDEVNVNFVGSLDFEEDFKILNLYEMKSSDESTEKLSIPKHEKAS